MKTWIQKKLKKTIPANIRARIYSLLYRFESLKTGFWRSSKRKFPKFYGFLQGIFGSIYLRWLNFKSPDTYQLLIQANLPARLLRTIAFRLSLENTWKKFPVLPDVPVVKTDVLFVSYSAHPDLVKMCIALKRARPGIRCTLIATRHAHTQNLCKQWFDEVVITGRGNNLTILSNIQKAQTKVVIMRFRDIVFHILARLYCQAPLIYYPPGFFLSSRSEDFLSDPELTFDEAFEADKYLLERVQGIIHFLSDNAILWFKERGVEITCPTATVYTACLAEQTPAWFIPKLSEKDGEWHIVHATGVEGVNTPPKMGGGAFLPIEKCRIVVNQGIHLHIYGTYFERTAPGYLPYVELEKQSKYFHIEKNLEFEELQTETTKYDLAWKHWDITAMPYWKKFLDFLTPNFFAYLQSGLPLLMSPKMPPLEWKTATDLNLGITIEEDQLSNLKTILDDKKEILQAISRQLPEKINNELSYSLTNLISVIGPYL